MLSLGFLAFGIIQSIVFWIYWSVQEKRCLGLYDSSLVKKNEKSGKYSIAPGICFSFWTGSFTIIGETAMLVGYHFDPLGIGITASIVAATGLASGIGAFLIYGEKLSPV